MEDDFKEYVIRKPHPEGDLWMKVRFWPAHVQVFSWRPERVIESVQLRREEALRLAALIYQSFPLDALLQDDEEETTP